MDSTLRMNARLRRRIIMKNKSSKRNFHFTDENSSPHHQETPLSSISSTVAVNRTPLSPLSVGNKGHVNSKWNSNQLASYTPASRMCKKTKSSDPDEFSPSSSVVSANHSIPRARCEDFTATPQPGHDSVIGSTPLSEIVDPSPSLRCSKNVSQPSHVIESVSSIRFNLEEHTLPHVLLHSDKYLRAECQEPIEFGPPSYVCIHCRAQVWFEERADKCTRAKDVQFSICCMKGKVQLPYLKKPPELLVRLMNGCDQRSIHYKENIRAYNSMFSFTSIGGKVESSFNRGGGPPQFILSGQNFHRIGSLIPQEGALPKFAQLYIYDTDNEISNRFHHFRTKEEQKSLDRSLVEDLTRMIDQNNELAKSFRRVRDHLKERNTSNLCLRLFRNRSKDARTYNLPTSNEVAALIVGDLDNMDPGRDIVVKLVSGELSRIHETHTAFIPLQYPLLFPYGEDGYQEDIPISDTALLSQNRKRVRVSMREFIAFRIQERDVEYGNIVNTGRLFQQFIVDCYTMIESQRLSYIRLNQKVIRCDVLKGLQEAVHRGETEPSSIGKRIILPASFTGGTRYMFNNCQDAMAICKRFGYPDLFITITCNANWREIQEFVSVRGLAASDRPDIVTRVFKMKLNQMMTDFKKEEIFGKVVAGTYTIEFQKRGLPHAHILLWLNASSKLKTGADIDKFISAELPDSRLYPKLARAVSNFMIHGPCGASNPQSPCMKDGKCSKFFPKNFHSSTTIDDEGYPKYKRQDSGLVAYKKGVNLDNRYVVPYNPFLLMRYQAHINVEYCNKSNSIKYLFKYVNKGPDRATIQISNNEEKEPHVDEIRQYYDCRYLAPCEAAWRIFENEIHHRWPPVQRLSFHLPNEQPVLFSDKDRIDEVVGQNDTLDTMFLAWFEANRNFEEGRDLTYAEFPTRFVYLREQRKWKIRKQGHSIGRLNFIPAGSGELYYMRILLTMQKGCTSYNCLKTVNGTMHKTFQEAYYALGLLDDDKEFIDAITEASELASGNQLSRLFVTLLVMNTMSKPYVVWNSTWKILSDGIMYERRKSLNMPGLQIEDDELKNLCLIELEKLLLTNGRSLKDFDSMPCPNHSDISNFQNKFLVDELMYDKEELSAVHLSLLNKLTAEQRSVYDQIIRSVHSNAGGFFFLYGYGGTGKTFVWNTLSAALRSEGLIVLNVASSGIASLLLPGGKTAHSTFCIPLVTNEDSTCNIRQGSHKAKLLLHAKLIIWDEAPMLNRFCFEAVDRTLRDIMRVESEANLNKPFGGKVVVLGGDFRQILPVIRKGCRHDIVSATINSSDIWNSCRVLTLTANIRLSAAATASREQVDSIKQFADWILQIGDGTEDSNENGESHVEIPHDLLIKDCEHPLDSLVQFTYPKLLQNFDNSKFYEERAILAPTLDSVDSVNDYILSLIPRPEIEYLSSDSTMQSDEDCQVQGEWFTVEFLNDIRCSGIPAHRLRLKVGVPIILMRNLDQANGLCNGTRLLVNELCKNVIGATVITGNNIGDKIYIPRMNLVPSDPGFPFKFRRRQFPVSLCFAMTINKSQGQSLSQVGLYLQKPVFTHGQLYVAISRVKSRRGLKILILDDEGITCSSTTNVVYTEIFKRL